MATRYLFYSHDGYGLGHVRRNSLIARAVLDTDPAAQVSLVTGLDVRPRWLRQGAAGPRAPRPADAQGDGRVLPPREAFLRGRPAAARAHLRDARRGRAARRRGRRPPPLRNGRRAPHRPRRWRGDAGPRWCSACGTSSTSRRSSARRCEDSAGRTSRTSTTRSSSTVTRHFVDHEAEYGLRLPLHYCGWVVGTTRAEPSGAATCSSSPPAAVATEPPSSSMGAQLLAHRTDLVGLFAPGPYAGADAMRRLGQLVPGRARVVSPLDACGQVVLARGARSCAWRATTPPSRHWRRGNVRS